MIHIYNIKLEFPPYILKVTFTVDICNDMRILGGCGLWGCGFEGILGGCGLCGCEFEGVYWSLKNGQNVLCMTLT